MKDSEKMKDEIIYDQNKIIDLFLHAYLGILLGTSHAFEDNEFPGNPFFLVWFLFHLGKLERILELFLIDQVLISSHL